MRGALPLLALVAALGLAPGAEAQQAMTLRMDRNVGPESAAAAGGGCTEATTFLARTSGLNGTQTSAYTTMICGLVTDGVWPNLDGFWVFPTNTTTTANLNLKSASFTLTSPAFPSFTAGQGYTGNGSTQYLDTGINPSGGGLNYTQNAATIAACTFTNRTTGNTSVSIGAIAGTFAYIQPFVVGTGVNYNVNGSTFPTFSVTTAQGSMIVSRTSSSAYTLYINGASSATATDTSTAVPSGNIYILAANNSGTPGNFNADQVGWAAVGALTGAQSIALHNRVHAFLVAVGAPSGC